MILQTDSLPAFVSYLQREERSACTVEKYRRDVARFLTYVRGRELTKALVVSYKHYLQERDYAPPAA